MYWAADRIGGPVGKTKCTETEEFSEKCRAGALAGDTARRPQWQAPRWHERAHGPLAAAWRSGATVGRSFLKEAARRRHDSGLLKFRTPTEIQVSLLAAASMACISSYADINGVRRAAEAVEVGSRP